MTDIPSFSTTLPNRRQSQAVFDAAFQGFIDALPVMVAGMNQLASELNALAAVTIYNAGTTYNLTGYTKPSTVYASDGTTYRCVGNNVVGDNPVGSVTGNWVAIILRTQDLINFAQMDIIGGDITKTGANQLTITPCRCIDSTRKINLETTVGKTLAIPAVANTSYHIFLVRLVSGGTFEFRAYTKEAGVVSDGQVNAYRYRGWWPNTAGAVLANGWMINDILELDIQDAIAISTNPSTTPFVPSYASFFPASRVARVGLWGKTGGGGTPQFTFGLKDAGGNFYRMVSVANNAAYGAVGGSVPEFLWVNKNQLIAGLTSWNTGTVLAGSFKLLV
jgi:hypothetical protein